MKFDFLKLWAICHAIVIKDSIAKDNGEDDFVIRLTHDDAKMILRGLLLLDKQQEDFNAKAEKD